MMTSRVTTMNNMTSVRFVLLSSILSFVLVGCSESLQGMIYKRGEATATLSYPSVQYGHIDSVEEGTRLKVCADNGKEYWFTQPPVSDWIPKVGDRVKLLFSDDPVPSGVHAFKVNQALSVPVTVQPKAPNP